MQRHIRNLGIYLLAAAGTLAAADAPYMGKWKLNPAKSDFGEETMTFTQTASGEMQFTAEGQSYTFKTDGKDYPAMFGTTAAWKQIDASTWQTTEKMKDKVLGVDTTKLSADGKTLTMESKGTKPNGEAFDDTTVYSRVSGTSGIAGKWKTKNVKISAPGVMELTPNGPDGLTWNSVDQHATCASKFDGKDYPCSGETFGPGFTFVIKKTGASSFEGAVKHDGKTLWMSTYTVSADGKTMTESGMSVATGEKYKTVYDRQ
jgi:hypothetical protein